MRNVNKLAAAITLALAAGTASAAVVTPGDTANVQNFSSIVLSGVDNNVNSAEYKHTFIYDLALGDTGLNYGSFVNGTQGTSSGLSWNLSAVSQFAPFLSDLSSFKWSVIGGYQKDGAAFTNLDSTGSQATYTASAQWGLLSTATIAGDFKANGALNISNTLSATGSIGAWLNHLNNFSLAGQASNVVDDAPYSATQSTLDKFYSGLGQDAAPVSGGASGKGAFGTGATTEGFFWATNPSLTTSSPNTTTELGSFTLSSAGVLTYTPTASAVPVPASVWLFASGLFGALGLKRRSQKAAI
ncbi:VPLPA-CTERM sorting domain-containing protein [Methylomonas paludis]|uniref:VPLPA-CTERM sorting domain-containing protein n=1 Tax=Methylomonas paludis TaxID=1173101 RepID=A0A975ML43_9GAMM|nr:PEP-CTERM sorting domain-containing protein [Methylomonas paludis]QWF69584.1 VPLPA-CTERM sorting domain-containing protein [Methylomonas paludis]